MEHPATSTWRARCVYTEKRLESKALLSGPRATTISLGQRMFGAHNRKLTTLLCIHTPQPAALLHQHERHDICHHRAGYITALDYDSTEGNFMTAPLNEYRPMLRQSVANVFKRTLSATRHIGTPPEYVHWHLERFYVPSDRDSAILSNFAEPQAGKYHNDCKSSHVDEVKEEPCTPTEICDDSDDARGVPICSPTSHRRYPPKRAPNTTARALLYHVAKQSSEYIGPQGHGQMA